MPRKYNEMAERLVTRDHISCGNLQTNYRFISEHKRSLSALSQMKESETNKPFFLPLQSPGDQVVREFICYHRCQLFNQIIPFSARKC